MDAKLTPNQIDHARRINLIGWLIDQGHDSQLRHPHKGLFCSPFRDDTTPSLSISEKNGIYLWHDFGTKEGGDAIDFVQRYNKQTFPEAVRTLLDYDPGAHTRTIITAPSPKFDSSINLTHWHQRAWSQMKPSTLHAIQRYFTKKNLPWIPETQPIRIWIGEQPYDRQSKRIPFLAWPTPNPYDIQAFECRAMVPTLPEHTRRGFPTKTLWIHHRPGQPVLITESIHDCLAGERLFGLPFTHIALNGVNQQHLIPGTIETMHPPAIFVALDHEPSTHIGHKTQQAIIEALTPLGIPICQIQTHIQTGTKDLLRLLQQHPQGFPASTLSDTGIWTNLSAPNNLLAHHTLPLVNDRLSI